MRTRTTYDVSEAIGDGDALELLREQHETSAKEMTAWGDGCESDSWTDAEWAAWYRVRDEIDAALRACPT